MMRPIRRLLLGLAILCTTAQAQQSPPALRQSFDISVPRVPTPVPLQGGTLLTYEVHLTNFSDDTLSVKRVRVLDPAGTILADFSGEALEGRMAMVAGRAGGIAPGRRAVLFVELDLPSSAPSGSLRHVVDYGVTGKGRPVPDP